MKRATREWIRKAEADYRLAEVIAHGSEPFHDQLCFHCQQSAEKYLCDGSSDQRATVPQ
jgi:HEPN domain-containing protein